MPDDAGAIYWAVGLVVTVTLAVVTFLTTRRAYKVDFAKDWSTHWELKFRELQREYDQLKDEHDDLRVRVVSLEQTLDDSRREMARLQQDLIGMYQENQRLKAGRS